MRLTCNTNMYYWDVCTTLGQGAAGGDPVQQNTSMTYHPAEKHWTFEIVGIIGCYELYSRCSWAL